MANPRVYEYAKEIGMETLALMDKIKGWDLPIKNHMASLEPEMIEKIQEKLAGEKGGKKAAKKKTVTKKKKTAAKKTAAKKTAAKKKTAVKKTAVKKTAVKKAVAKKSTTVKKTAKVEAAAPETEETGTKKKKTVIRRRAADQAAELAAKEAAANAEEEQTKEAQSDSVETTETAAAVETPAAAPPKRNIVGKIDLARVRPTPSGGDSNTANRTPRPAAGRNIRPGFVAAPVPGQELPVAPKVEKDKAPNKKQQPKTTREVAQPTQFAASEFRKREMVFQPKKKRGMLSREANRTQLTKPKASKRVVKVNETMRVSDLAQTMGVKTGPLMKALMKNGVMAKMSDILDFDTIALIAPEFEWEAVNVHKTVEELVDQVAFGDLDAEPIPRAPVVTVMGHVDHGKTSLLDAIRQTDVAAGEAGGITQHIGAYSVRLEEERIVTFIDTPGHEAFTAMRARGANCTDIVVIVVAADDGVMPQTVEAINHAKAADVPIIVAVNKIDKPDANVDKIKQQVSEHELVPEEWGGTTIFCEVSALKRTGVKELLEQLYLVAEMQELKANPKRSGTGIVIESRMEKGRGNVATFLVRNGTIGLGQYVVAGGTFGKVRGLFNDRGEGIKEAGPSIPVEILGLNSVPKAGDYFDVCKDAKQAEEVSAQRKSSQEQLDQVPTSSMSLDDLFAKVKAGSIKELPIVLKTDVAGSSEAVKGMISKVGTDEVQVKVIHDAVGGVSESDVLLAGTAGGLVIGFNVRPDGGAQTVAQAKGVEIRCYSVVYELVDDLKKAMAGLLDPDIVEKALGRAEVRDTFSVPKIGMIAGCSVVDGKISRNSLLRLVREGRVIYEGKISSLKRFKDDAKEVQTGFECGIGIENYNDIKVGDVIEAYFEEQVAREL